MDDELRDDPAMGDPTEMDDPIVGDPMEMDNPIVDFEPVVVDHPTADLAAEPRRGGGPPRPRLTGSVVRDCDGRRLGTVSDVIFDARSEPQWMVVDPGLLRRAHLVPARAAAPDGDGTFAVPFPREVVQRSPRVGRDHVLSAGLERELERHYELA